MFNNIRCKYDIFEELDRSGSDYARLEKARWHRKTSPLGEAHKTRDLSFDLVSNSFLWPQSRSMYHENMASVNTPCLIAKLPKLDEGQPNRFVRVTFLPTKVWIIINPIIFELFEKTYTLFNENCIQKYQLVFVPNPIPYNPFESLYQF